MRIALAAALVMALAGVPKAEAAEKVLTGDAAFGSWQDDAPGVRRLIRPDDLPPPLASRSASNGPRLVTRPKGAMPKVPEGFTVDLFAEGLQGPRTIRVAPNGDIFVAESEGGRIHVFRAPDGAAKPATEGIFADGLDYPYGIAFYPPGPDPKYVYVAQTDRVMRFPYASGDLKARGKAEVLVEGIPGGVHITRDIAFSPDGKRMFLAVGSASNDGEGMGRKPPGAIGEIEAANGVGAAWGAGGRTCGRARLRSRRQERPGLRERHPQLCRAGGGAGLRRPLVRHQRARRARRQSAARLRLADRRGRLLWLALVLHRQPRRPAPQGRARRTSPARSPSRTS